MKTLFPVSVLTRIAELHANDPDWDIWQMTEAQLFAEMLLLD